MTSLKHPMAIIWPVRPERRKMKRAAIYLRVSTDRQAREGDSIPAQRDALLKYIDEHEDLILAGTYLDDGISGTKADRDELNRLLDDVKAGKIDQIIFTKLDRWFRSIKHYVNTQEILDKHDVTWLAIWEPVYNTTTPAGRLIINQMLSIAQFEAENTGQRIRQVFDYKKSQGEVCSGNVPPGYRIQDKHLVIDSDMAPAVREVFEHYAQTGKLYDTVRISALGLPKTKQGIKTLLKRRIYIGEAHGNPNFCEPIISRELFEAVQLQLSRNIKNSQKHAYLFSGLIRCAECGRVFASGTRKYMNTRANVYRCPAHYQHGAPACTNTKVITEHVMERWLLDNLKDLMEDFQLKAEAAAAPAKDVKKQRDAIEAKFARLTDLYVDGQIKKADYLSRKESLLHDLDALVVPPEAPESHFLAFEPEDGIDVYHSLGNEEKRLFWRSIIKEIRFAGDRSTEVIFL